MLQFGIPGGPELLILLIVFAMMIAGLLSVLAIVGVVVFLVLRSGSEPDESGWDSGDEADREPVDTADPEKVDADEQEIDASSHESNDPTTGSDGDPTDGSDTDR